MVNRIPLLKVSVPPSMTVTLFTVVVVQRYRVGGQDLDVIRCSRNAGWKPDGGVAPVAAHKTGLDDG